MKENYSMPDSSPTTAISDNIYEYSLEEVMCTENSHNVIFTEFYEHLLRKYTGFIKSRLGSAYDSHNLYQTMEDAILIFLGKYKAGEEKIKEIRTVAAAEKYIIGVLKHVTCNKRARYQEQILEKREFEKELLRQSSNGVCNEGIDKKNVEDRFLKELIKDIQKSNSKYVKAVCYMIEENVKPGVAAKRFKLNSARFYRFWYKYQQSCLPKLKKYFEGQ